MPKPTKLHSKGKANSIQKPFKVDKDVTDNGDQEESLRQFQLELCWCIQQLERSLGEKKGDEKQLQEAWKVLTVLKNNNQPVVRKRQLMRTHFGDYRAKMAAEEKKLAKMASKMKISEVKEKPKATYLRKSFVLTKGEQSFLFNFELNDEIVDHSNETTEEQNVRDSNIPSSSDNGNTNTNSTEINTPDYLDESQVGVLKNVFFLLSNEEFKFNFIHP